MKNKNADNINELIRGKKVASIFESHVKETLKDSVIIDQAGKELEIPDDYLFIFAGGVTPFGMLKKMGI